MRCPWCVVDASPRRLHAHLADEHASVVRTEERHGSHFYAVTCPRCGESYEHMVRKSSRDPSFVEEFGREIRMVALDMLVHHLVAEHEQVSPDQVPHDSEHGAHSEHSETGA